jgi:hypothetical protein
MFFVREREGMRSLGSSLLGLDVTVILKLILQTGSENVEWIRQAQGRSGGRSY